MRLFLSKASSQRAAHLKRKARKLWNRSSYNKEVWGAPEGKHCRRSFCVVSSGGPDERANGRDARLQRLAPGASSSSRSFTHLSWPDILQEHGAQALPWLFDQVIR